MSEIAATEPVTQLDFQEAMRDFKFMFPEMDSDVIEAVLRANHGAVDATIDQLLTMNTDYENEKVRHPSLGSAAVETAPPSYNQVADQPADESLIRPDPVRNKNVLAPLFGCQRILGVPLCSSRGWKPALLRPLPADFLRVERHRSSPRHAVCFFILINHRISFFLHLNLSLGRLEITIDRFDRITIDSMANLPAKTCFLQVG